MHAYDIEMLTHVADRSSSGGHGWCFGLPPGIKTEQWPLDPNNGYPLMHGFTLLLPEDYRVHGPDIVGLSFFATAPDHNDGGPAYVDEIAEVFRNPSVKPTDSDQLLFWQSVQLAHPRLHRMQDILECSYAVILLTQDEFDGPLCMPPRIIDNRFLRQTQPPRWMEVGSARDMWECTYSPHSELPAEEYWVHRLLGQVPERSLAFNRALRWSPRANDPNAGKAPCETTGDDDGYRQPKYNESWLKAFKPNHIGGTMQPAQSVPSFSPFYMGFEEYFGGYNFGSGNAQLDFRDMQFDWACD